MVLISADNEAKVAFHIVKQRTCKKLEVVMFHNDKGVEHNLIILPARPDKKTLARLKLLDTDNNINSNIDDDEEAPEVVNDDDNDDEYD